MKSSTAKHSYFLPKHPFLSCKTSQFLFVLTNLPCSTLHDILGCLELKTCVVEVHHEVQNEAVDLSFSSQADCHHETMPSACQHPYFFHLLAVDLSQDHEGMHLKVAHCEKTLAGHGHLKCYSYKNLKHVHYDFNQALLRP